MTPERFQRITQVLKYRQHDLVVLTDEVHKSRNLSAIIRSCDAVGVDTVISVVPKLGYQTYAGTSASAEKWVNVEYCAEVQAPLERFKAQGFQVIAANLSEDSTDYRNVDYTVPTLLVLGAEVEGISDRAKKFVDKNVVIPMFGMVESFNVSVAGAVILMEARCQREKAGLYDDVRIPQALYKQRFFKWAHPVLAQYCDDNGLQYPPVDEEGEVIDLPNWYRAVREAK